MRLSFDLREKGSPISNIAKALCIWDFNTFDDQGAFGRMPEGWFKAQNPFLEYVILMTFTGGAGRGEWVSLDAAGKPVYDFSTPLRVLINVLRQGLRPIIVLGNVPYALSQKQFSEYDSYEWGNRCAPDDYAVYFDYIRAFGRMIREHFPASEYRHWAFRVGTEPDNPHWWTLGEAEYCKLYDYTVAALEEALGGENITVFSGNLSVYREFGGFYRHCDHGINYATGKIGTRNDAISISHYNDLKDDGCEFTHLRGILKETRELIGGACPGKFKSVNVGEGQFIQDGSVPPFRLAMGQDLTSYAASWTAHMFDALTEAGLDYFANWTYYCDCFQTNEPMLRVPAWYAADFMGKMAGGYRVSAQLDGVSERGNTVGGFLSAPADDKGVVRGMIYNHCLSRENHAEQISVQILGLSGDRRYACRAWVIDEEHSGFAADWLEKSRSIRRIRREVDIDAVGSIYDSEVFSILEEKDQQYWLACKRVYCEHQHLERADVAWNDQTGQLDCQLGGHGVLLVEWMPV